MDDKNYSLKIIKNILVCFLFISIALNAQNLHDIKLKTNSANITLEQALKYIEQNTKFNFTYNKELLPLEKIIQFKDSEESLYQVLYNVAKVCGLTFNRISNQIVVKKSNGKEQNLVIDSEDNSVVGKVIDSKTNEPLQFVSVYLSGTSIGTTTDGKGIFRIANIPHGNYELVASMVGYEAKIISVELKDGSKYEVNFSLEPTLYRINQIDVNDEVPTKWKNQLELFKKLFFGNNKFAEYCIIKNEYQLNFSESKGVFTASIKEPLVIVNNALGYKINCELKKFEYQRNRDKTSYRIYPSFTEIIPSTKDSLSNFISNRNDAYYGSLAHLLSTLADKEKNFHDEGFEIFYSKGQISIKEVELAEEIVAYNADTKQYFLKIVYASKLRTRYPPDGLLIRYQGAVSKLTGLYRDGAEFDPRGFFIDVGFVGTTGFTVLGEMAKEGMATQLPRFWKPPNEKQ